MGKSSKHPDCPLFHVPCHVCSSEPIPRPKKNSIQQIVFTELPIYNQRRQLDFLAKTVPLHLQERPRQEEMTGIKSDLILNKLLATRWICLAKSVSVMQVKLIFLSPNHTHAQLCCEVCVAQCVNGVPADRRPSLLPHHVTWIAGENSQSWQRYISFL